MQIGIPIVTLLFGMAFGQISVDVLIRNEFGDEELTNFSLKLGDSPKDRLLEFCTGHLLHSYSCDQLKEAVYNELSKIYPFRQRVFGTLEGVDYCFVTAYYDIGRDNWEFFRRSNSEYFYRFAKLLRMNVPLIIFIDNKFEDLVHEMIELTPIRERVFTVLIGIDEQFLEDFIPSWEYIPVEQAVMQSPGYQELISARPEQHTPETLYPRYNCINHAKVDFLAFVIEHRAQLSLPVTYLGWVDFGYLREEFEVVPFQLNRALLFRDQVSVLNNVPIDERTDGDPRLVLSTSAAKIHGAFFFGSTGALLRYRAAYHEMLREMHARGVADDDQAVMLLLAVHERRSRGSGEGLLCVWTNAAVLLAMPSPVLWSLEEGDSFDGMIDWGWYVAFILFNSLMTELPPVRAVVRANLALFSGRAEQEEEEEERGMGSRRRQDWVVVAQ